MTVDDQHSKTTSRHKTKSLLSFTSTHPKDLEDAVFQTIGYASMCWTETPTGRFEAMDAASAGDMLIEWINRHYAPKTKGSNQ